MPTIILTEEQDRVLQSVADWFEYSGADGLPYDPSLTLGGYAGTGKTTVTAALHRNLPDVNIAFCSFTGKAVRVLTNKLIELEGFGGKASISTIHSLIYHYDALNNRFVLADKLRTPADLIVVDEASMVQRQVWEDLLSFDVPIFAIGDHGQLPPIDDSFNLMANPQLRLETIHRQAEDSAIIRMATLARKSIKIPYGSHDGDSRVRRLTHSEFMQEGFVWDDDLLLLCATNRRRVGLNKLIRITRDMHGNPQAGDRVICLKNNRQRGIYNGMTGEILSYEIQQQHPEFAELVVQLNDEDRKYKGIVLCEQFGAPKSMASDRKIKADLWDFGYALTVHKAQGSQAKRVIVMQETWPKEDRARWLYTAITRATDELTIVG